MLSVMLVKLVNKRLLRIEQITRIGYYLEFLNTCGLFFQSFILVPSLPYFPLFFNKRFWSVTVQLWPKVSLNERISVSALFFFYKYQRTIIYCLYKPKNANRWTSSENKNVCDDLSYASESEVLQVLFENLESSLAIILSFLVWLLLSLCCFCSLKIPNFGLFITRKKVKCAHSLAHRCPTPLHSSHCHLAWFSQVLYVTKDVNMLTA